jgi:hypothetical protein
MPLTSKGEEIKNAMEKQYGEKKGEQVFYASKNAGKISGVDEILGTTEGLKFYGPNGVKEGSPMDYAPEIANQGFGGVVMAHEAEKMEKTVSGEKSETGHYDGSAEGQGLGPKVSPGATFIKEFPHDPFKDKGRDGGFDWEEAMSVGNMTGGPLNIYRE